MPSGSDYGQRLADASRLVAAAVELGNELQPTLGETADLWRDIERHLERLLADADEELARSVYTQVQQRHGASVVRIRDLTQALDAMPAAYGQVHGRMQSAMSELAWHRQRLDPAKLESPQVLASGEQALEGLVDALAAVSTATGEAHMPVYLLASLHHDALAGYLRRPGKLKKALQEVKAVLKGVLEDLAGEVGPVATVKAIVEVWVPEFEREKKRLSNMRKELDRLGWLHERLGEIVELSDGVERAVHACKQRMLEAERDFDGNATRLTDIYRDAAR